MQNETMIYGYARVSTAAQDESGQVKQLKAAGCEKARPHRHAPSETPCQVFRQAD
jgi:DNA invertase Pin-like site-specific DNA recombinase